MLNQDFLFETCSQEEFCQISIQMFTAGALLAGVMAHFHLRFTFKHASQCFISGCVACACIIPEQFRPNFFSCIDMEASHRNLQIRCSHEHKSLCLYPLCLLNVCHIHDYLLESFNTCALATSEQWRWDIWKQRREMYSSGPAISPPFSSLATTLNHQSFSQPGVTVITVGLQMREPLLNEKIKPHANVVSEMPDSKR